ncbi:MAG: MGH1-like glycoside hydrolase domain-containing protein [Brevefilum sp.]
MEPLAVDRDGPQAFILAPDGTFSVYDPENDHIWGLRFDAPEPCPFQLHTTYQLRARSMRVFPNLITGGLRPTKPEDFIQPPTVTAYTPGTLHVEYCYRHNIQVQFIAFIPQPDALLGAIRVKNTGDQSQSFTLEMAAVLIPMAEGNPTHPETVGRHHILSGKAEELYQVLFMSGGPTGTNNPYPALQLPLTLAPGQSGEAQWALATKTSQASAYDAARRWMAQDWYREMQIQTKAHEKHMVFIKTGQPDWDTTFHLAQVNALTHLINPNPDKPQPTFIRSRLPDQPMRSQTRQNDLSDLTLLDSLHLAQVLLPAHADRLTRLVETYIARVDQHGFLPSGAFGGKGNGSIQEPPLLANLCLMLFETHGNLAFLKQAFPNLQRYFETGWLAPGQHNHLPTWNTPTQLQLDSGLFNFDIWEETGQGLDIRTAESPAMAAMLYREAKAMKKIAHILGDRTARQHYGKWEKKFQEKLHSLWNEAGNFYSYQDIETHQSPPRDLYFPGRIQPELSIAKVFTQPQRLQIYLTTQTEHPQAFEVRLEGQNKLGEPICELILPRDVRWVANCAHFTTREVFSTLDAVYFSGFSTKDRFLIKTADYSQADLTCLLPIWSGGIHKDHLAALLAFLTNEETIDAHAGIPETWRCSHLLPEGLRTPINILWNTLIIEGLTREGCSAESATLFTHLMSTILRGLHDFNGFYPAFDHNSGLPIGGANAITGLAPMRVCLKIAGIQLLSPDQVVVWGKNPFPWPIEVRWQGLWLHKEGAQTTITFPDGTRYHSRAVKPRVVRSGKNRGRP